MDPEWWGASAARLYESGRNDYGRGRAELPDVTTPSLSVRPQRPERVPF